MAQQIVTVHDLRQYIGQEVALTDWLLITQEQVQKFAEAAGDHQWIHTDPARAAAESPYGGTVAHGFLTLSLLSQFLKEALEIQGLRWGINYGFNRVRFPAPVRVGSRLRARFTLLAVKDVENAVEAMYQATLETEDVAKPACVAEWLVRYY